MPDIYEGNVYRVGARCGSGFECVAYVTDDGTVSVVPYDVTKEYTALDYGIMVDEVEPGDRVQACSILQEYGHQQFFRKVEVASGDTQD